MNYFHYVDDELWCEETPISHVVSRVGTPLYLYSLKTIKQHFQVFDEAFAEIPHLVCYAVKANSNIAILRLIARLGGGVDIVSGGELYRALVAGIEPKKIVYSGVGKRIDEIDYALANEILMFNIESPQELELIDHRGEILGKRASIAIRVNPDVNPETHPHISTGLKENKFGIDTKTAVKLYLQARKKNHVEIKGISCHIGSQITKITPFQEAFEEVKKLIRILRGEGITIDYIDIGGGLGIKYNQEEPPHPSEYARSILSMKEENCTFILEPGRVIVGNAGVLVTKVLYIKESPHKNFVIVDAGMNDLIRPSFYNSYHKIQPVKKNTEEEIVADVVGPICESGDYFAKGRKIAKLVQGELIAIMSAGAYGFSMSSNYNARPRAAEVLVDGSRYYVIRERETYADLIRGEIVPDFLK